MAKTLTPPEALHRAAALCSSSEHCIADIREKLSRWGIGEPDARTIVERLVQERFIDEGRYAIAFAKDKSKKKNPVLRGVEKKKSALPCNRNESGIVTSSMPYLSSTRKHTRPASPTCSKRNLVRLTTKMSRFDAPNYFVSPRPEGSKPN